MAFYQCIKLGGGTGDVADVEVNGTSVVDPISKVAEITSYEEVTESEYEAIPVAERESNGIAYFIKDLNNESVQGYPPLIYSDEEREIGVWRDGKPLYQITVDQTIGSDSDYTVFASGIDHAHLVNSKVEYSSGRWMSFDYISLGATSNSRTCYVNVQNGALKLHNQTNQSMRWVATIQYTKTTDVAGSGTWNGQGGLAHHYSTNETVIGTWIDGKPLYECTFTKSYSSLNGNATIDVTNDMPSDIEYVKAFEGTVTHDYSSVRDLHIGDKVIDFEKEGNTFYVYTRIGNVTLQNVDIIFTIQYTKTTD